MLGAFYYIADIIRPCLEPVQVQELIKLMNMGHDKVNRAFQPGWHRIYYWLCLKSYPMRRWQSNMKMNINNWIKSKKEPHRRKRMQLIVANAKINETPDGK